MQITDLRIRNFKSIKDMHISGIENALILVGQNDTGKTAVLDAVRAVGGDYIVREEDFRENFPNVEISVELRITEADLKRFHRFGEVSTYRRYEAWYREFCRRLPSFLPDRENGTDSGCEFPGGTLTFEFSVNREGRTRYGDGHQKNNRYIPLIFPHIYFMDTQRNLEKFQDDLLLMQEDDLLKQMRSGCCMFDMAKECNRCFSCIGLISKKTTEELNAFEAAKLLEYKLYNLNLDVFSRKVNENFRKNGGRDEIVYSMNLDIERTLSVTADVRLAGYQEKRPAGSMGKGMRSIRRSVRQAAWGKECEASICFRSLRHMRRRAWKMRISLWWKIRRYFSIRSCRRYQVTFCTGCRERIRSCSLLIHLICCRTLTADRSGRCS